MSTKAKEFLRLRQFLADMVPAADLRLIFCGVAIALFLAWLF